MAEPAVVVAAQAQGLHEPVAERGLRSRNYAAVSQSMISRTPNPVPPGPQ